MTTFYVRFTSNGRYTEAGAVSDDAPMLQEPDVYIGRVDRSRQYHTPNGPVDMPPRPGEDYSFNYDTKTWEPNLEVAKARVRVRIDAERDGEIFNPIIVYDGKNLDADAVSIDRLSKKLAALDSYEKIGMEMPAPMLVWRDADNVTHVFATHTEYKQWLAGFAVALDLRGTQAFAVSWSKKELLEAATTIEEVIALEGTT